MLLALVVCHLFTSSFANPFHKYPFVFLLDVGNEELERINTEQLRVSVPGGSVALRYPAVGEGDTIAHVRVSGIDFGTDLKANIIDGGPGYKYVVLVFIGNTGVPYDAVLTVQTVPSENLSKDTQNNNPNNEENDPNDSAEDLSDSENGSNQLYGAKTKAELMQSSSNEYYVHESNKDYSESDGYLSQKNIHDPNTFSSEETAEVNDYVESDEDENNLSVIPKDEECDDVNDENDDNSDESPSNEIEEDQSEVFDEEDDPNFNEEHEVNKLEYTAESEDYEDSEELDQTFNDDEVHGEKYKDSNNNNYIEADDNSAVAY